jgi:hypothetical protein
VQPLRQPLVAPLGRFAFEQQRRPLGMAEACGLAAGFDVGRPWPCREGRVDGVDPGSDGGARRDLLIVVARPTVIGMDDRRLVRGTLG